MPSFTLGELAQRLGAELIGDDACEVTGIATLISAQAQDVAFLDNPRYQKYLKDTKASAVILSREYVDECPATSLVVANPYYAFAELTALMSSKQQAVSGRHPSAVIADSAKVSPDASIGPLAVIGDNAEIAENVVIGAGVKVGAGCVIGARTRLYDGVTIYNDCTIHEDVIIHSGAVIGSDGFGFAKHGGKWFKVEQIGSVVIHKETEIGANTTIDRGAIEDTVIGRGVKLDNQIQVGHNVKIGDFTAIAGCSAIAGSAVIGQHCLIGGGVCIAGHLSIADNVAITAMTGVSRSILKPGLYSSGIAAQEHKLWQRNVARIRQLDTLFEKFRKLKKVLNVEV